MRPHRSPRPSHDHTSRAQAFYTPLPGSFTPGPEALAFAAALEAGLPLPTRSAAASAATSLASAAHSAPAPQVRYSAATCSALPVQRGDAVTPL